MLRRTRLGLLAARELTVERAPGVSDPVERVGAVIARELGWSPERLRIEIERFAAEAAAEGIVAEGGPNAHPGQLAAPPAMP
jgi:hypothetical protein